MANGSDWQRVLQTTIAKYIREVEVNILRNRKLLALMQKKGRVVTNDSGTELNWKVRYKRAAMIGYSGGDTVTFARRDRIKTATLGWRAYQTNDQMDKMEKLQNRGAEAIVKNYDEILTNMSDDMEENFCDELYIDGNAAGNGKRIHGIESFLGAGANILNGFTAPSDSYAGLSTVPQNYGGNWTGTWPAGAGDAHYDFFSPILVNYTDPTSGVYGATTKTWPNTCIEALRFGITKTRKAKSKKGMLDLILLEETLFDQFKNAYEGKQDLHITRGEPQGLWALGFTDTINFDGVDITSEFGMPLSTGYMFNTMQMELRSMQDRLFVPEGPYYDEESLSDRWLVTFFGNARFNPKFFGKLKGYGG